MIRLSAIRLSALILFMSIGISVAAPVLAANHTVMPLAFNLNVEKRDIVNETITLTNTSTRMVRVYPTVNEVATDGSGVVHKFIEPSAIDRTNSPTTWVEIGRGRIELQPGETREVPLTIRMNPNTEPGNYSVFVGFPEASNEPQAVQKVLAGQAPGTLVNLAVDTTQDQFLRLEQFKVDRFVTGHEAGGEVQYRLQNVGQVDVRHAGEVIFYNSAGEEVDSTPLNPEGAVLAREASEVFTVSLPDLPAGKYRAYLSVEYGDHNTDSVQDTTYFYVIPLIPLLISFVVVLLLSILVALYVHRRYDIDRDDHGAESVVMYVREGESLAHERDIDLKRTNDSV